MTDLGLHIMTHVDFVTVVAYGQYQWSGTCWEARNLQTTIVLIVVGTCETNDGSSKSRFSLLGMEWLILVRTSWHMLILCMSSRMDSISDREPVGRQETCKQLLFWLWWGHVRPMMVVLKVDSHCWGWNDWSWSAHHDACWFCDCHRVWAVPVIGNLLGGKKPANNHCSDCGGHM